MSRIDKELLLQSLSWRYAVQKFDPSKKISSEDLETLLHGMNQAPTSYGLQPFQFLVIENPEVRKKLQQASWNQTQIVESSHLIVLTTLRSVKSGHVTEYMERIAKTRGIPVSVLGGFHAAITGDFITGPRAEIAHHWSQKQAYIAMGFLMMTAALIEIDTCPMEGLDPLRYDEVLNLTESDYSTVAAVSLGYRASDDKAQDMKKVRKSTGELYRFIK